MCASSQVSLTSYGRFAEEKRNICRSIRCRDGHLCWLIGLKKQLKLCKGYWVLALSQVYLFMQWLHSKSRICLGKSEARVAIFVESSIKFCQKEIMSFWEVDNVKSYQWTTIVHLSLRFRYTKTLGNFAEFYNKIKKNRKLFMANWDQYLLTSSLSVLISLSQKLWPWSYLLKYYW